MQVIRSGRGAGSPFALPLGLLAIALASAFVASCVFEASLRERLRLGLSEHRLLEGCVLVVQELLLLGAAITAALAAHARFSGTPAEDRLSARLSRLASTPAAPFVVAGIVFVVLLAHALLLRRRFAETGDENAYLFQATLFSRGTLFVPSPPLREFFDSDHLVNDGRMFAKYPPGWPLLLTPFVLLGIPWLAGPLLSASSLVVLHRIGREAFDERTALLATAAVAASPLWLVIGSSYLSHPATFFLLSLFALHALRALRGERGHATAAIALGLAFLCRPLTALSVAAPFAIAAVVLALRGARGARRAVLGGFVAFVLAAALYLVYNALTTGDPLLPGHLAYNPHDRLGFGIGIGGSSSASYGIGRASSNAVRALVIWSMGFLPGGLAVAALAARRRWTLSDVVLSGSAASLFAAQALYHYPLENYYVESLIGFGFLFARGATLLKPAAGTALVSVLALAGAAVVLPRRDAAVAAAVAVGREPLETARAAPPPAIVLFKEVPAHSPTYYVRNDPALNDPVLLARDLGERNAKLKTRSPERRVFRYRPGAAGARGVLEELHPP